MGETKDLEVMRIEEKFAKAYYNLVESERFNNLTVFELKEVAEYIVGTYDQGYAEGFEEGRNQKSSYRTLSADDELIQVRK